MESSFFCYLLQARFPKVFRAREALARAQADLMGLLPVLQKQLQIPRLDYVSIQNQGNYLIEVPIERRDVPKV
jgi:DNA mismatch repair protein MSH3